MSKSKFQILSVLAIALFLIVFGFFYVLPAFRGDIKIISDFYIGPVRIHLYGLIIGLAILLGYWVVVRHAKQKGLAVEHIDSAFPWIVLLGFIAARVYYVAFEWERYANDVFDVLKVWQGGLSIYGAILGGILGAFIYAKRAKISLISFLDVVALGVPLAQSLGRWGNFFNQEAFGLPTNLPWRMYVEPVQRPFEYLDSQFFHPAFLYESLWDLFVFFMLIYLFGKRQKSGFTPSPERHPPEPDKLADERSGMLSELPQSHGRKPAVTGFILGSYLIFYSIGRFFIESIRLDSSFVGQFRADQIVALILIMFGTALILKNERAALENS
ncbi:MAG: prolipoprotein diacylglyceryl transferase [Candidatus Doudnabacteria bacterium]|nr:prolipoprotein diacylglyceryl transferase [Candidatus Doudnabacteria bacterium]